MGPHKQSVLPRQVTCKEGQEHPYQYPGIKNIADSLSKVQGINEGEDHPIPDRQHNSNNLSTEGGSHSLQVSKWSCEEYPVHLPCEWGKSVPRIHQRHGKPPGRCPIPGQKSSNTLTTSK